jgi:NADH-quinone oxidoreductase subunit D
MSEQGAQNNKGTNATGAGAPSILGHLFSRDLGIGGVTTHMRPRELHDDLHTESMILNMGPAHPATHGTVRIAAELSGERIIDADVELGYLHRGFEKMCENVDYNQVIPYTDRLNYVSPIINNVGWSLTIEKLLQIEVPKRCQYLRVLLSEMSRVCDHLTCLGASAMEIGAFTVFLYLVEAREYLWELIEEMTGARLTISWTRVGGVRGDMTPGFPAKLRTSLKGIRTHLANADRLLTRNRIFIDRMCDIAVISKKDAVDYGLTGPLLRASGVEYDVRKAFPYSSYEDFEFEIPLGTKGDNYDRFLVRFHEIEQSMRICEQVLDRIPEGPIAVDDPHVFLEPKDRVYNSIDGMINHFELVIKGVQPPVGEVYIPVEGGNGELGFFVVSDGSGRPYKVHVRPPCFVAMGMVKKMLIGHTIADVVPTFGMVNMIGGECDR